MAKLDVLGITVPMSDAHVERVKNAFPDLSVRKQLDLDKVPGELRDVDAFVGRARHVSLMADATNLRWVQTLTAGADAVPIDEMTQRGIVLTNGSGIHAPNLAEHILGLMLAFARGMPQLMRAQSRREWLRDIDQFELQGQTLCVIGLGDIGLALAERASAIGMRVTGVRRRDLPAPSFIDATVRFQGMDNLIAQADHIAICLPLTESTRGMFNADRLEILKPGAFLYNVGRGEIVDQVRLTEMLRAGRLGGAGLDVTTPEPLPQDHPLWDLDNVIITAHTGGRSPRRLDRFVELLIDNITRYRNDQPLRNVVDLEAGY